MPVMSAGCCLAFTLIGQKCARVYEQVKTDPQNHAQGVCVREDPYRMDSFAICW